MNQFETVNCAALLFEIRDLNRMGVCLKFRYGQTLDANRRAAYVRNWQHIECRKRILKSVCLSATEEKRTRMANEKLVDNTPSDIPSPPPLPKWVVQSAMEIAMTSSEDSASPSPPPLPSWTVPLMLKSAKSALRSVKHDKAGSSIHSPPPLPLWVFKANRSSLKPVYDLTPPVSPPRPGMLQKNPVFLKKARHSLKPVRFLSEKGYDVPQPPPLPCCSSTWMRNNIELSRTSSSAAVLRSS